MLEKYLNKNVVIFTQVQGTAISSKYKGIVTGADENFVELDNQKLISIKFIYSVTID